MLFRSDIDFKDVTVFLINWTPPTLLRRGGSKKGQFSLMDCTRKPKGWWVAAMSYWTFYKNIGYIDIFGNLIQK